MKVVVQCPAGHRFHCSDDHLGKAVRCPREGCNLKFILRRDPAVQDAHAAPQVTAHCPSCRSALEPHAVLCIECGTRLLARVPPASPPARAGAADPAPASPRYFELLAAQRSVRLSAGRSSPAAAAASDVEVLRELRSRETAAGGWKRAIIMLAVSLGAFVVLGLVWMDPLFLALAVPILFVHELGHYIAMRAFGYRDVKMFFIPLMGAAVHGTNHRAAGWQRAVVSLAGPVPSLLIGYGLLAAWCVVPSPVLGALAALTIVINASNLIPVFPLDGGHFLNEVIFSRFGAMEIAFRLLTGLALLGLAVLMGAWILAAFAASTLVATAHLHKLQRIAADASESIGNVPREWSERVPDGMAEIILRAARRHFPHTTSTRDLAAIVERVWERMRGRPPGALASTALMSVYLVAWISVAALPFVLVALMINDVIPVPEFGPLRSFMEGLEQGMADARAAQ